MKKVYCDLCEQPALKAQEFRSSTQRSKGGDPASLTLHFPGDICTDCLKKLCDEVISTCHREVPLSPQAAH